MNEKYANCESVNVFNIILVIHYVFIKLSVKNE